VGDVVTRATAYTLFGTEIGWGAIAWNARAAVVGVHLPEPDPLAGRRWARRRFALLEETPPPADVARAIAAIVALLRGEPADLTFVTLEGSGLPASDLRVYAVARAIPPGQTRTYGQVAAAIDGEETARDVGAAMARNPFPIVMPCHRVVAADGRPGGFSAPGGVETKLRLLAIEGAPAAGPPRLFDLAG
jgi:methylated-DNA-[protein]-cysteine S-methyltransferase